MSFIIYSIQFWRFWWNLVQRFLDKFAAKSCKRFSPHLNDVTTLPCETWNAHQTGATIELQQKETPEFIQPQLWPPNSPDLKLITVCEDYCKRRCKNIHHWSGRTETATENGVGQAGSCRRCSSHSSVASSVAPDKWWVFCTPSLAIFLTYCYQLNSNLANLETAIQSKVK